MHSRRQIKSVSLVLAVSQEGVVLSQYIKGGLNMFSFVKYIDALVHEVVKN